MLDISKTPEFDTPFATILVDGVGLQCIGEVIALRGGEFKQFAARIRAVSMVWDGDRVWDGDVTRVFLGDRKVDYGTLQETKQVYDKHKLAPSVNLSSVEALEAIMGPDVNSIEWGMNDTYEGGYMVAILNEWVQFNIPFPFLDSIDRLYISEGDLPEYYLNTDTYPFKIVAQAKDHEIAEVPKHFMPYLVNYDYIAKDQ